MHVSNAPQIENKNQGNYIQTQVNMHSPSIWSLHTQLLLRQILALKTDSNNQYRFQFPNTLS